MGMQLNPRRVRYAAFVIALVALTVILFLMVPRIWSVLQVFIIATLIALALDGLVRWQTAHGVPRWVAVVDILLFVLIVLSILIYFLLPPLARQFSQLVARLPALWTAAGAEVTKLLHRFPDVAHALRLDRLSSEVLTAAGSWFAAARSIFASAVSGVTAVILIIVTVLYTLLNPWPLLYGVRGLFPASWWPTTDLLAGKIARGIRAWVIGTIVLGGTIAIMDYLALTLINHFHRPPMPFVLFLAMIGGLLEVVPIVGPIVSTMLATLIGLSVNPLLGLLVLLAYLIVQQIENHILVPLVMGRFVRAHPVSLIVTLFILTELFGLFGAVIAVPVTLILKVLYNDWYYPLIHDGEHPISPPLNAETGDIDVKSQK